MQETRLPSLGQGDPLEKGLATHSSVLTWEISGTEDPGDYSTCKELDMTQRLNNNNKSPSRPQYPPCTPHPLQGTPVPRHFLSLQDMPS